MKLSQHRARTHARDVLSVRCCALTSARRGCRTETGERSVAELALAARRAAGTRRRGALHLQTTSPRCRPTLQQPQLDSKT